MKRQVAEKNIFIRKPDNDFLLVVFWRCFAYLLGPYRVRVIRRKSIWLARETPPSGENIFIRKPGPDFLLVSDWQFCVSLTVYE
jgi:hypothetical protein